MSFKAITVGAALVLAAGTAAAQQRGTVELGLFGSAARFDKALTLNHGIGAGGHVGIYLDPRLALEFEKGEFRASRTLGLEEVNVGSLTGRVVYSPVRAGRLSILTGVGAGAGTETNFMHSYGVNALLGAKIRLSPSTALRIDGISDWLANNDWHSYQSVHVGLTFARNPARITRDVVRTVEVPAPVQTFTQRPDSVSARETARLRQVERDFFALRDSLLNHPPVVCPPVTPSSDVATMEQKIHFATDKSTLSDSARVILDSKVGVFRANPSMRIMIVGNTDERATDAYNMSLGQRRSNAARDYLIAQGINASRIEVVSEGERNPTAAGTSVTAQGLNRRAEFRLLIATEPVRPPQ